MRRIGYSFLTTLLVVLSSCGGKQASTVQKPVRVKVQEIGAVQVNGENAYSGTVEAESGVSLSFPVAGTVQTMAVDQGQMVSRGQLVATINATGQTGALQSAHAVTQQARQAYRQALDTYKRSKGLHQSGVISDSKWVQAQTALAEAREAVASAAALETIARKGTGDTRLTAPFSGYISEKAADVGQNVLPGVMVAKLVHIDRVKISISVPEDEVNQIQRGEEMMICCEAVGGATFYGKVILAGDDLSGLLPFLPGTDERLRAGQGGTDQPRQQDVCVDREERTGYKTIYQLPRRYLPGRTCERWSGARRSAHRRRSAEGIGRYTV